MIPYPKYYLADVPQDLRLKVLDLCIHRQWHEALDLLHQSGFTQYEWYELVWFHDHAPTNLPIRTADGPSALECGGSTPPVQTLTGPNLNAEPRTRNPEPVSLTVGRDSVEPSLNGVPVKVSKPRSKIGRLPKDIQDDLNAMLVHGRSYTDLIHWLNDQGYPGFNKVNLHTWKQTGLLNRQRTDNQQDLDGHQKVSEGVQKPVEGDRRS